MFTFSTSAIITGIILGAIMGILSGFFITWGSIANSSIVGEEDFNIDELNEAVVFHNED